jgi:excisionase family DNA binding protein
MSKTALRPTMSVDEAAKACGISRRHAYNLVASGDIPSVRLGKKTIRVPTYRLIEMIEGISPPEERTA